MQAPQHPLPVRVAGPQALRARRLDTGELFVFPHSGRLDGLATYGPVLIRTGMDPFHRWIGAGDFTGDGPGRRAHQHR